MRDRKFRGVRVDTKEMIYGDLLKHSIIDPFTYIAKGTGYKVDDPELGKPIKVMPHTVGEFTSLQDAHNVDIYENDIVRLKLWEKWQPQGAPNRDDEYTLTIVQWDEEHSGFHLYIPANKDQHKVTHFKALGNPLWYYEVLGNIWENPELLNETR
jgi:uncharacterized phage protein (TIGR01671 family)